MSLALKRCVRYYSKVKDICKTDVRVTLLGGDTALGAAVALQLKIWAVVSEMKVHGSTPSVRDLADDLNEIPTRTRVTPYSGPNQLRQALYRADVVMIYDEVSSPQLSAIQDEAVFDINAPGIERVAKLCVTECPDAVFALLTPPLNSTLPLFAQVLRENGVLKATRVLGIVSDLSMTARQLVSKTLGLNPKSVWVPITGGASPTSLVPVISGARPGGVFLQKESKTISEKVRSIREDIKKENNDESGSMGAGYAVADFIRVICTGLQGTETDAHPALVRTRAIDGIDYLVLPVQFGPDGVSQTHGVPDMSRSDMALMDTAIRELGDGAAAAKKYLSNKRTSCVACDSPPIPDLMPPPVCNL